MFRTKHLPKLFVKRWRINSSINQDVKLVDHLSTNANAIEEKTVNVDGININYARTGIGQHAVLLLPGVMGTIWTDFKHQIVNLNKEELTIIAWDPPGYGKSRPPNRQFPKNFHKRDATWARNLMKSLGFDKFSLIGWSDGGITSLVLAATYPENVRKTIAISSHAYITHPELTLYDKFTKIDTWSEKMKAPLIAIYGEKYFQDTWIDWLNAMRSIFENNNGDIYNGDLSKIKCPSLIVNGNKDPIITKEHLDYLHANIKNSKGEVFNDGGHNLHLKFGNEFNALAHKFLLDEKEI